MPEGQLAEVIWGMRIWLLIGDVQDTKETAVGKLTKATYWLVSYTLYNM